MPRGRGTGVVNGRAMRVIDNGMDHRAPRMGDGTMMRRQNHRRMGAAMTVRDMAHGRRRGRDQRAKGQAVGLTLRYRVGPCVGRG
mgnify:FL=1